jgi:hypothetical protein
MHLTFTVLRCGIYILLQNDVCIWYIYICACTHDQNNSGRASLYGKMLNRPGRIRTYHRGYILYVQQWKTILSSPTGVRVGVRKARAVPPLCNHCTGLPLSVFHHVSSAWPLDMIRINPSNPMYVYTSRAMIVRYCYYSDACSRSSVATWEKNAKENCSHSQ